MLNRMGTGRCCCGPCDGAMYEDDFASLNSKWNFQVTPNYTMAVTGGQLVCASVTGAIGQPEIRAVRCATRPADYGDKIFRIESDILVDDGPGSPSGRCGICLWTTDPGLGGSIAIWKIEAQPNGGSDSYRVHGTSGAFQVTAPYAPGDRIRMELEEVAADSWEQRFYLNNVLTFTPPSPGSWSMPSTFFHGCLCARVVSAIDDIGIWDNYEYGHT